MARYDGWFTPNALTGPIGRIDMRDEGTAFAAYLVRPAMPDTELGRIAKAIAANAVCKQAFENMIFAAIGELFSDAVAPI